MSTAKCRKNEFVELVLRGDSPEVGRFFRTDPQSRGKIIVTIRNACVPFLTWTHVRSLIRVENESAREWYLQEAVSQTWSSRTLDRNISTQYYGRLLISKNTAPVKEEMVVKTSQYQNDKLEFVKNPVVAEFLGLKNNIDFTENELEQSMMITTST